MSDTQTNKTQIEVLLLRAEECYDKRDYTGAIRFYDKIIKQQPEDTWSLWERGLMKFKKKDYQEALKDFEKVIELDPEHSYSFYQIGLIKEKTNNKSEAKKLYEKAAEIRQKITQRNSE